MKIHLKKIKNNKITFILSSGFNLFFHTLNLYGQLGGASKTYQNTSQFKKRDKKEKKQLLERKEIIEIYSVLCKENIFEAEEVISFMKKYRLEVIFRNEWKDFYKEYWKNNYKSIKKEFTILCSYEWEKTILDMEKLTGYIFKPNIIIIPVEGCGDTAYYSLEENLSIGGFKSGGFRHEGFHLLLRKQWAENKRIKKILEKHKDHKTKEWGTNTLERLEQGIVVSLDSILREMPDYYVKKYFEGCYVGNLYKYFYKKIKFWYENGCREELTDLLYIIIKDEEQNIFHS